MSLPKVVDGQVRVLDLKISIGGVPETVDYASIVDSVRTALVDALPEDQVALVVADKFRLLSLQGWKNMSGRVFGEYVEKATAVVKAASTKIGKIVRTGHDGKPVKAGNCVAPVNDEADAVTA